MPASEPSQAVSSTNRPKSSPLVGLFFHSVKADGKTIVWQGYVKGHIGGPKDLFLVQLYEWAAGTESDQELISSEQMAGWKFYDSAEEMNNAYYVYSRHREFRESESFVAVIA